MSTDNVLTESYRFNEQKLTSWPSAMSDFESHRQFYQSMKDIVAQGIEIKKDYFDGNSDTNFYTLDKEVAQFIETVNEICIQESAWFEKVVNFLKNFKTVPYDKLPTDQNMRKEVQVKLYSYLKNSLVLRTLIEILANASSLDADISTFLASDEDIGHRELLDHFDTLSQKVSRIYI